MLPIYDEKVLDQNVLLAETEKNFGVKKNSFGRS